MTSQYRHRRFSDPTKTFTALEPGEIGVNTSNRQLTVGDATSGTVGAPVPLLAIRIFDARAIYAIGDFVTYTGIIYRANQATGPVAFNSAHWDPVAGQTAASLDFVLRSGDTMTGHLTLPPPPGGPSPSQAVRRDYVDSAIALLPTKAYVDTQDVLLVRRAGDYMTGPLTLFNAPTESYHAATKEYVDQSTSIAGAIMDFAMATPPAGWLACDGQAISRSTYPALFAAIGTLWGAGDGSLTFNVPNFMTRYRRHRDDSPAWASVVGTLQNPMNLTHQHSMNFYSQQESANHAHYTSGATNFADRNIDHLHSGVPSQTGTFSGAPLYASAGATYVNPADGNSGAADRSIDHVHVYGAWSGTENTAHSHWVSGWSDGAGGSETRPYSATVLTCIKW